MCSGEYAESVKVGGSSESDAVEDAAPSVVPTTASKKSNFRSKRVDRDRLCVKDSISPKLFSEILEPTLPYAEWLRLVLLRSLVNTPVLGRMKDRSSYNLNRICSLLGFENFEQYAESRSLEDIEGHLRTVLEGWERLQVHQCRFPKVLEDNLISLSRLIGLEPLEQRLLGLGVLIQAESIFEDLVDLLGASLTGHNIERILAPMLGEPKVAVAKCLERQGRLYNSGLLSVDLSGRYDLRQLMDFLTATFPSRMLVVQEDPLKLVEGFVRPTPKSELNLGNFEHLGTDVHICRALLEKASTEKSKGCNILIYGRAGTGKSEFARVLLTDLGLRGMEVATSNIAGAPVAPIRRFRNYRIAQAFLKKDRSAILFDECEEALNSGNASDQSDDEAITPRKSYINQMLEGNEVPCIWIANSVNAFDEAYLRRFSLCLEMPVLSSIQREALAKATMGGVLNTMTIKSVAENQEVTPALLTKAARIVEVLASTNPSIDSNELAVHWLSSVLKAQRKPRVLIANGDNLVTKDFDPELVNCGVDLGVLRDSVLKSRAARLCIYGPPGTGKTAFGKWIAREMDASHLLLKASDILSPYLGETEQRIARAFEEARQKGSVLQFDEVDSFLQDRRTAHRQWEITQVNEMLTQMDNFRGVFIASTNLFESLDEASLRRFDSALKFDFMKPNTLGMIFKKTCDLLGLQAPDFQTIERLSGLSKVTPGDFEQSLRRARLEPPKSPRELLTQLEKAVSLKRAGPTRGVGFLTAA